MQGVRILDRGGKCMTATKMAVLNQKGGVGKTTVAVNLAYGLAQKGRRVLLVDLDPQAHASLIFRGADEGGPAVQEVFERRGADLAPLVRSAMVDGRRQESLWLVPSDIGLAAAAERLLSAHYRERRLHAPLEKVLDDYDYVVLDCPPNLGLITVNGIYTADRIIVPVTYGRYALEGTADLLDTISIIREEDWSAWSVLRNGFDARNRQANAYVTAQLEGGVEGHLMRSVVRRSEGINKAQIRALPVAAYDPKGYGAQDFEALTEEVVGNGW